MCEVQTVNGCVCKREQTATTAHSWESFFVTMIEKGAADNLLRVDLLILDHARHTPKHIALFCLRCLALRC